MTRGAKKRKDGIFINVMTFPFDKELLLTLSAMILSKQVQRLKIECTH